MIFMLILAYADAAYVLTEMLTKAFLPEIVGLVFIVVGKRSVFLPVLPVILTHPAHIGIIIVSFHRTGARRSQYDRDPGLTLCRSLADAGGNILAGSVVDSDIVHSRQTDFYLCSHSGIIGSAFLSSNLRS